METERRIYAASLSDYNAGRLHGVWIDLDDCDDVDDIWKRIHAMLAASPEYRAFPQGGPAEEYAIHDHEGWCGWNYMGEWVDMNLLWAVHQLMTEHPPRAVAAWLNNLGRSNYLENDELDDAFREAYAGHHDSKVAWAGEMLEELGIGKLRPGSAELESIENLLDMDAVVDHYETEGYWFAEGPPSEGVYAFREA